MATESPKQRSDEATLTSSAEPTIKIDTDSQNVDLNRPHVNGDAPASATDEFENKHISDIVDDLVNSTEVSISGGSDTEAARSDASKSKDDAKGHGRVSSSVKKPASFKAINVNKTFLTAKAPAPGAQPKNPEKAPPAPSAPSPTTGIATATRPRLVAKSGSGVVTKGPGANGAKSAPDASAVWNKNRPVPPPEPKKYTDEELKKYGIHMATRLHPDASKGQSNWADIDDDDEDWDPDTITWQDGTKIAIAPAEDQPPPAPEPIARPVVKENGPVERTKAPAPSTSPSIKTGVLASGKGLVLKGAPEKPTLVAKPPAPPTPAKSPWAPLPKIDKVSPIAADAPAQAGPRFPPKDAHMHQAHGQLPPKEIAADDFSRAPWRDGAPGANRELFNSQSGRYEPVLDRRGPMRQEQQYGRQPPLMQRPPHHEQQGPMEYPGAFQAGRNNEQQGPYGRRRGSSNVSGGSGSWQRLKGPEHPLPPPELINARRASMTVGSDGPASPNFSPSGLQGGPQHGQPWLPRASPGTIHATPYPGGTAPDGRVMPPPVQPSPSVAPAVPVTEDDYELQKRLMRERRELAMRRRQEEEAREEAARKERIRLKLEALGPAPESNKAKKAAVKEQVATPTQIQPRESISSETTAPAESPVAENEVPRVVMPQPAKQPIPNGPSAQASSQPGVEARPQAHGSSNTQPWVPTARQADRPPAVWGPQPSTKNVWAAPNNNRSLGNGTFAADIGAPPIPSGPGPIAPPSSARAAAPPQANMAPAAGWQPPIGPPRQPQASRGTGEREMKENPWAAAVRLNDDKFSEMLNAQYEERDRRLQAEGRSITDVQPTIKDTWRPTKLDDSGARIEAATKQTLQIGQEAPWAGSAEAKPVASQQAPSVSSGAASEYSQLPQSTVPRDIASASMIGAKTAAAQGRGSRFFPSARQETRDIRLEMNAEALRHTSPSPPPPDMAGHPAFDGDATHPHVSLPRPYPVVRLPPSMATESQASAPETSRAPTGPSRQGPSFAWASQPAYKEADNAPRGPAGKPDNSWQAKIDSLLGGRKVHPSRAAGADARGPHQPHEPSLPGSLAPYAETDGSATTKVMDEECFEEQEMGSVPPIRLPKTIPEMAWQPSPAPKALNKKLWPVVLSADSLSFPVDVSGAGNVWRVCIPGTESKVITVPFGRTRSNPRRGGPRGGRHNSSAQHRQGKGREPSSSYSAEQRDGASGSSASHGRSHRGGYRGRENWSRNAATQIQT
ncbi:hypothetical protein C8A01DRAFT_35347 [Parachaetomium inaequale]|uniref:Uncharacterized protein n=1 Tax=Parachaetomium inaequale TaxID=2588326 RepID=A0AAN6PGI8_9PEZI|nr:hypothetical protein C8A01DRAFT_35347 [Parachaetomium inaequale]